MPQKGYKQTEEHKRKIGLANLGYRWSDESKKSLSLVMKGKNKGKKLLPLSEEHKKRISLANKNCIPWNKNKKISPFMEEHKKKLSLAQMKSPNRVFKNTSIELKVQQLLKDTGIEFETNYPILGRPDIFIKPNVCIFVDGCYYHDCYKCKNEGKPIRGIRGDKDKIITQKLQEQGYSVIRIWEHEIKSNQFSGLNQLLN